MLLPDPDQRRDDAVRNDDRRACRPVPRPFRVAVAPRPYCERHATVSHDLVEGMIDDLKKYPPFVRLTLLIGGAGALWMVIFHLTQALLK